MYSGAFLMNPGVLSRFLRCFWKVTGSYRPWLAAVLPHSRLVCLLRAAHWVKLRGDHVGGNNHLCSEFTASNIFCMGRCACAP